MAKLVSQAGGLPQSLALIFLFSSPSRDSKSCILHQARDFLAQVWADHRLLPPLLYPISYPLALTILTLPSLEPRQEEHKAEQRTKIAFQKHTAWPVAGCRMVSLPAWHSTAFTSLSLTQQMPSAISVPKKGNCVLILTMAAATRAVFLTSHVPVAPVDFTGCWPGTRIFG